MFEAIGWNQSTDDSDQWDGFNDSGIEHFRGNPIFHLGREINQNAMDAAEDGLVKVNFIFREIETNSIPNLGEFKEIIKSCLQASQAESERAKSFFEHATKMLAKKSIGVLEISDSNTHGIKGPAVNGTPFFAFMKATGQSKKDSQIASGSYGIGKFAPYAVSSLRTIFVSTVYCGEDGKWQQLTQGKSVLMSHDYKGKRRRGVGFWGYCNKCKPITGTLPKSNGWLQRAANPKDYPAKKGTTIIILGFEPVKNWRELLAVSVAENFFGAIGNNKLEVNIDNELVLSHNTIHEFFDDRVILNALQNQKDEPERFNNCKTYLEAIQSIDEVQVEETENRDLGLCAIRILVGEHLPKKVCILRNGMMITDELNRLKSFPDFKEFVAVMECKSSKGNQLLRDMEPPRHDDFEPERLPSQKQAMGKKALSDLAKWAREMLKRHAKDPISDVTTLDELKDFFGDELSDGEGKETEEVNPVGKVIIRARPLARKPAENKTSDRGAEYFEGEEGGGSSPLQVSEGGRGEGGSSEGDNPGRGTGTGEGEGGSGGYGKGENGNGGRDDKPSRKLLNIRAVMNGIDSRKISFTPLITGAIRLQIMGAGADTDHNINLIKSSEGVIKGGCVVMNVKANCRTNLDVEMEKDFDGSIKVSAYEV